MFIPRMTLSLSRRAALMRLGLGGIGAAFAAVPPFTEASHGSAQTSTTDLSNHPMVGTWLATTPSDTSPALFAGDGTVLLNWLYVSASPDGAVQFNTSGIGTWEPVSERGIHFTVVQANADPTGIFSGTTTVDGYPEASEDGTTFYDDATQARITIRDATGATVMVLGENEPLPAISGVRMGPGNPGFPESTPESGTPAT